MSASCALADAFSPLAPAFPPPQLTLSALSDDVEGDQRLPHNSGEEVSFDTLAKLGCIARPSLSLEQVEQL